MASNLSTLSGSEFDQLAHEVDQHKSLRDVLAWAASKPKKSVHSRFVAEVITQDEFTHDVVIPYENVFLVYDTT
jgi:hypothetical protein